MPVESEPSKVRILPESLINKIAAGEVVERPASVVKELVENSLDAGADQILVTLKNGGKDLISVLDNGSGMNETDALHALERHATSKISAEEDLFRIHTLGFRGEALAAISSVSRLELTTCSNESKGAVQFRLNGGVLEHQGKTGFPRGTKISVEQLFFNTPARLKFMKSTATELQHTQQLLQRLALAAPSIQFRLTHNQQMLLNLSQAPDLEGRIQQLFGEEVRDGLMPVQHQANQLSFEGWISLPSKTKTSRRLQYLFVNGRHVKCPALNHGIYDGYKGLLAKGKHPAYFLKVDVAPEDVDVNVHPAKTEIRFRNSQLIHTILADQLSRQIHETTEKRFFGREVGGGSFPQRSDQVEFNLPDSLPLEESFPKPLRKKNPSLDVRQRDLTGFAEIPIAPSGASSRKKIASPKIVESNPNEAPIPPELVKSETGKTESNQDLDFPEELNLFPNLAEKPEQFKIIGMLHQSQILMEHEDGLAVGDVHTIHKVLIEVLLSKTVEENSVRFFENEVPLLLELKAQDALILELHQKLLRQCGFQIDSFGGTTFSISSLPFPLAPEKCAGVFKDFVSRVSAFGKRAHESEIRKDLIQCIAGHAALDRQSSLNYKAMNLLIAQMEQLDLPPLNSSGERLWFLIPKDELIKRLKA